MMEYEDYSEFFDKCGGEYIRLHGYGAYNVTPGEMYQHFKARLIDELGQILNGGMTLRDYFAARAMQALVSQDPTTAKQLSDPAGRKYGDWIASDAYGIADAMLQERDK